MDTTVGALKVGAQLVMGKYGVDKDNPNPMLRASGLAALAYNARPEYKSVMKEIFELSKQDADENVQKVAEEGLAKLATVMDAPAATEAPSQAA